MRLRFGNVVSHARRRKAIQCNLCSRTSCARSVATEHCVSTQLITYANATLITHNRFKHTCVISLVVLEFWPLLHLHTHTLRPPISMHKPNAKVPTDFQIFYSAGKTVAVAAFKIDFTFCLRVQPLIFFDYNRAAWQKVRANECWWKSKRIKVDSSCFAAQFDCNASFGRGKAGCNQFYITKKALLCFFLTCSANTEPAPVQNTIQSSNRSV